MSFPNQRPKPPQVLRSFLDNTISCLRGNNKSGRRKSCGTQNWTLVVVITSTIMLEVYATSVQIVLVQLRNSFGASLSQLQWVISAYALTLGAFALVSGSLSDHWGQRRVMSAGITVFTASSFFCGISPNIVVLDAMRAFQGIGGAIILTVGTAMIGREFRDTSRARALALLGSAIGIAMALGPVLGGVCAALGGWRLVFLAMCPLGIVLLIVTIRRLPDDHGVKRGAFDWRGGISLILCIGLLLLVLLKSEANDWSVPVAVLLIMATVGSFALLLWVERKQEPNAILDFSIAMKKDFYGASLAALLSSATLAPSIFLVVNFAQNVLSYSVLETGLRTVPWMLFILIGGAVTNWLSRYMNLKTIVCISFALVAISGVLGLTISADDSFLMLLPLMMTSGLGVGLGNPTRIAIALRGIRPDKAGIASGYNQTFYLVGTVVGMSIVGNVFQRRIEDRLADTALGAPLTGSAPALSHDISTGLLLTDATYAKNRYGVSDLTEIARNTYVGAFHDSLLAIAGIAVVAVFFSLTLISANGSETTNKI